MTNLRPFSDRKNEKKIKISPQPQTRGWELNDD